MNSALVDAALEARPRSVSGRQQHSPPPRASSGVSESESAEESESTTIGRLSVTPSTLAHGGACTLAGRHFLCAPVQCATSDACGGSAMPGNPDGLLSTILPAVH